MYLETDMETNIEPYIRILKQKIQFLIFSKIPRTLTKGLTGTDEYEVVVTSPFGIRV